MISLMCLLIHHGGRRVELDGEVHRDIQLEIDGEKRDVVLHFSSNQEEVEKEERSESDEEDEMEEKREETRYPLVTLRYRTSKALQKDFSTERDQEEDQAYQQQDEGDKEGPGAEEESTEKIECFGCHSLPLSAFVILNATLEVRVRILSHGAVMYGEDAVFSSSAPLVMLRGDGRVAERLLCASSEYDEFNDGEGEDSSRAVGDGRGNWERAHEALRVMQDRDAVEELARAPVKIQGKTIKAERNKPKRDQRGEEGGKGGRKSKEREEQPTKLKKIDEGRTKQKPGRDNGTGDSPHDPRNKQHSDVEEAPFERIVPPEDDDNGAELLSDGVRDMLAMVEAEREKLRDLPLDERSSAHLLATLQKIHLQVEREV